MPTAERAARPAARARAGASSSRAPSTASAWATASASFVPEPSPACCGIASTTRRCAPLVTPSASWQRRANSSARSASTPSADSSSARSASSTTAGRLTATPRPPKRRGPSPAAASMPRCRRAGASTRTVTRPVRTRAEHVVHRRALPRPRGLVDEHLQPVQLGADLRSREQMRAGGEDRRLEHRVAGAIEAEELAPSPAADDHGADHGALRPVVDRLDADLAPRAGVVEHRAGDSRRGTGRRVRIGERRLAEEQDVVGEVHDRRAGGAQVAQRPCALEGLDDDPLLAPLDAHRAAVDGAVGVDRRHHGLDDGRAALLSQGRQSVGGQRCARC